MRGCCFASNGEGRLIPQRGYGSTPRCRSGTSIPAASETPGVSNTVRLASTLSQVAEAVSQRGFRLRCLTQFLYAAKLH
jgi:hypothetical protein